MARRRRRSRHAAAVGSTVRVRAVVPYKRRHRPRSALVRAVIDPTAQPVRRKGRKVIVVDRTVRTDVLREFMRRQRREEDRLRQLAVRRSLVGDDMCRREAQRPTGRGKFSRGGIGARSWAISREQRERRCERR